MSWIVLSTNVTCEGISSQTRVTLNNISHQNHLCRVHMAMITISDRRGIGGGKVPVKHPLSHQYGDYVRFSSLQKDLSPVIHPLRVLCFRPWVVCVMYLQWTQHGISSARAVVPVTWRCSSCPWSRRRWAAVCRRTAWAPAGWCRTCPPRKPWWRSTEIYGPTPWQRTSNPLQSATQ